jgi:hypothetical protein
MTPTLARPACRAYRMPPELLARPARNAGPRPQSLGRALRRAGWLLVTAAAIVCHGCHGPDMDDELCLPPPAVRGSQG